MEKNNGLPSGWVETTLEYVANRISNGINAEQTDIVSQYPISRIETISFGDIDYNRVKYLQTISQYDIEKYKIEFNDILFSHINSNIHLGKTAIFKDLDTLLIHGVNLLLIRVNENISADYINYYFKHLRSQGFFYFNCKAIR